MKRAERRHHRKRIIKRFHRIFTTYYKWYTWNEDEDPWMSAKLNAGRGSIGCGCCMCANPRRKRSYEYSVTRQEKINELNFREQIEELNDATDPGIAGTESNQS
jgi:hypothetical protein